MWTLGFGYDEGPHADTRLAMHPRGRDDRLGQEVGSGARSRDDLRSSVEYADGQHIVPPSSAKALPRRRWLRDRLRSRLKIREPCVMPLLFQPAPPPCVRCGIMTVVAPAFEEGQRVFVVRCPGCGRSSTY